MFLNFNNNSNNKYLSVYLKHHKNKLIFKNNNTSYNSYFII